MRGFIIVAVLGLLTAAAVAAESPEATAKRIAELQKANLVLQEDLARAQLDLDTTKTSLRSEVTARKDLNAALAKETANRLALEAQMIADITRAKDEAIAMNAALTDKFTALEAALAKANETIGLLNTALDQEKSSRVAAEADAAKLRAQAAKQAKRDRMMTYLGVLLGGVALGSN